MGHHHHEHNHQSNIGIAFLLNLVFTIIEIIGGLYTNSLAIISDAIHDLGDSLSLGVAWYLENVSKKEGDQRFTYGYKRFSVLGAIMTCLLLITGSVFIIYNAIPRLFNPEPVVSGGMIILAILGIVFNGLAFWKTHRGHSHNEKMVSFHLLVDLFGWVAVLIGAILIYFFNWMIIDPILSVVIAFFILLSVIKSLKKTFNIILQGTPDNIDVNDLENRLYGNEGVLSISDLHIWTLDGHRNILSVHIVINPELSISEALLLKEKIRTDIKDFSIYKSTIELVQPRNEQEG